MPGSNGADTGRHRAPSPAGHWANESITAGPAHCPAPAPSPVRPREKTPPAAALTNHFSKNVSPRRRPLPHVIVKITETRIIGSFLGGTGHGPLLDPLATRNVLDQGRHRDWRARSTGTRPASAVRRRRCQGVAGPITDSTRQKRRFDRPECVRQQPGGREGEDPAAAVLARQSALQHPIRQSAIQRPSRVAG